MVARLVRTRGWSNKADLVGGTTYNESGAFFMRETLVNASAVVTPQGTETFIGVMTFTNTTAATRTNELVTWGMPVANSVLGTSNTFNLYNEASPGVTGTRVGNFHVDNFSSEEMLSGARRFGTMSMIVSSFTASQTKRYHIYSTNTPTPSGTPISQADILATSFNVRWEGKIGAATVSANARYALTGTSVMSKTSAILRSIWRSGGACTEYIVESPVFQGTSVHAAGDGLHVGFHIKAWKADPSGVSAANPILGIETRVVVENGHANRSNTEYTVSACSIARATNLTNSTFISTTAADYDGNNQQCNLNQYIHYFGARYSRFTWVGANRQTVWAYGSVATAVSVSTNTNVSALARGRATPMYFCPPSNVTHDMSGVNAWPKTTPLQLNSGGGALGEYTITQGQGGEAGSIGVFSSPEVEGLIKWNVDGRRRIFEHGEIINTYKYCGQGRCYVSGVGFWGFKDTNMPDPLPSGSSNDFWQYDISHEPPNCFLPYVLTGDAYYLEMLTGRCSQLLDSANNYNGTGVNYTIYGPHNVSGVAANDYGFSDNQERGAAWGVRSQIELAYCIPDRLSVSNNLTWRKTAAVSLMAHTWERCKNVCNTATSTAGTGAGSVYARGYGVRYTHIPSDESSNPGMHLSAPWMGNYKNCVLGHAMDLGVDNANLRVFVSWSADEVILAITCTDKAPPAFWLYEYRHVLNSADSGTRIKTVASSYMDMARRPYTQVNVGWSTTVGGCTLSGLSGTSVNVDIPVTINPVNRSWYVGAYFHEVQRNFPYSLVGYGQITTVHTSHRIAVNVLQNFSTTNIPAYIDESGGTTWLLCGPHPSDVSAGYKRPNESLAPGHSQYNYTEVHRSLCAWWADHGIPGALSAYHYSLSAKPGITDAKWTVTPRS